jgi:hypothetical protein
MAEVRLRIIKRRHAMVKKIHIFLLAALLTFGVAQNSQAALFDTSAPGLLTNGLTVGVPAGFPVWYQDFSGPITRPDANPNYGIGPIIPPATVPTPGGLQLELCPDLLVNPLCLSDLVGDEFFWWVAETIIPTPAGQALLVLATDGTRASTAMDTRPCSSMAALPRPPTLTWPGCASWRVRERRLNSHSRNR